MTGRQLAELIDGHAAALVLFAGSRCATPEDVVQDAFYKLACQSPWPDDAVAWLYRVVRNRSIDSSRSDRKRTQREATVARPVRWFAESSVDGLDADHAVAALEQLPVEQREVIVARLWGGMTLEQIAAVAGCSAATAYRRFESGIAALREKMGAPCPKT